AVPEAPARQMVNELLGGVATGADQDLVDSTMGGPGNVVGSAIHNDPAARCGWEVVAPRPQRAWEVGGAVPARLAGAVAGRARSEWPVVHTHLKAPDADYPAYLIWIPGEADGQQWEDAT